jgi:nitrogen fixation protein NifB
MILMNTANPFNDQHELKISQIHPCLSGEANSRFGRIHLPVSPVCNIQCRFCSRKINTSEDRPGVTGAILKPGEAVEKVEKALRLCPEISVVGIAGPGDTLATDDAEEAFRLVHEKYPNLINCLSTNGLLLPEKAQRLYDAGVRTVTVTVNAVDPKIQAGIISHILYDGVIYTGEKAAEILIRQQLKGIRLMSGLGAIVKINTVLIPGINDSHIEEIAKTVREAGASIYNIIPLIPQHEFSHCKPPDCKSLNAARAAAEKYIPVFRHCQHCRADACGIPGKSDLSSKLYDKNMDTFSHG